MVTGIDRAELLRLLDEEGAQIVDVLPEVEYAEAHIRGAVNLPLKQISNDTAAVLDPGRPVVTYCHDGL